MFLFSKLQKFSVGFRSGEDGGHTIIFLFLMPNLARDCVVKNHLSLEGYALLPIPRNEVIFKKFRVYFSILLYPFWNSKRTNELHPPPLADVSVCTVVGNPLPAILCSVHQGHQVLHGTHPWIRRFGNLFWSTAEPIQVAWSYVWPSTVVQWLV